MVLAPHMDDEVIGAGGTLALHKQVGSDVGIVFTTDSGGQRSTSGQPPIREIRQAEARQVADRFGYEIIDVLPHPDGMLSHHEAALGKDLAGLIASWKPDEIFVPFPADHHRDHQATAAALAMAIEARGYGGMIWCYEIWSTLWPNVEVDITEVVDIKREAIELYASQVSGMSYAESALGLNRYRGLKVRVPFAEGFYVANSADYLRLAEMLCEI